MATRLGSFLEQKMADDIEPAATPSTGVLIAKKTKFTQRMSRHLAQRINLICTCLGPFFCLGPFWWQLFVILFCYLVWCFVLFLCFVGLFKMKPTIILSIFNINLKYKLVLFFLCLRFHVLSQYKCVFTFTCMFHVFVSSGFVLASIFYAWI